MENMDTVLDEKNMLILVGGVPGSGKTFIGQELSRQLGVFVDKDTVSQLFTERLLTLLGSHIDDRESEIYLSKVRDVEYQTMMDQAMDNLRLGMNVICSAPFIREFGDPAWLDSIEHEAALHDSKVVRIWIHADMPTTKERIIARAASRDRWKLENWDTYASNIHNSMQSECDFVIDNSKALEASLGRRIASIIQTINCY